MNKKSYVYFDNAATSLNKPDEVSFAVMDAIKNLTANPGRSSHDLSQRVAMKISQTREDSCGEADYRRSHCSRRGGTNP